MHLSSLLIFSCKKDDGESPDPGTGSDATLIINNGPVRIAPDATLSYTATIVDVNGNATPAANVVWTVSDQNVVTVSGNTVTAVGVGPATLTATVNHNGKELKATVPVGVYLPSIFTVAPGAIAYAKNETPIQLNPVYVGTGNPGTYTYVSSDPSIASVSSTGLVSFPGTGSCVITVKAPGLDGEPTVNIPVLVVAPPVVPLAVAKVVVTPNITDVLKGETVTFSAKAYNLNGEEVTGKTFTWSLTNDTIASVAQDGVVTTTRPGVTKVVAVADGIPGYAELSIIPNTIIEVSPLMASIAASKERQFSAKTYSVSKTGDVYSVSEIANPADLTWLIPTYGMPVFDIATTDQTGKVTVKSDAMVGLMTFVMAYSPSDLDIEPGIGTIMVSSCDCGAGTGVTAISTDQDSYTLDMLTNSSDQIIATTSPAGQPVSYCTDTPSVVSVGNDGTIVAMSPGTATITICNGSTTKEVTVTVSQF